MVTDRSQGGSSINDGELELMVHRRLLGRDLRGVGEALNETAFEVGLVVNGKHFICIETDQEQDAVQWMRRTMQEKSFLQPSLFFFPTEQTKENWLNDGQKSYGALKQDLPDNVNILTLEQWNDQGDVLLRLEHLYDKDDAGGTMTEPATVNLSELFTEFVYAEAVEMTLGGNMELDDMERLHWTSAKYSHSHKGTHAMKQREFDGSTVELQPMEIRTFMLLKEASKSRAQELVSSADNLQPLNSYAGLIISFLLMTNIL